MKMRSIDGSPIPGVLVYSERDYAFRYMARMSSDALEAVGHEGATSITLGTLQMEVAVETGRVLFFWG